jgi:hypothetical protein
LLEVQSEPSGVLSRTQSLLRHAKRLPAGIAEGRHGEKIVTLKNELAARVCAGAASVTPLGEGGKMR